jgi:hypothetical protein
VVNAFGGRLVRASYLGDAMDYEVALDGADVRLRVAVAPSVRLAPGARVTLTLPVEACVPLNEGE